VNTSRKRRRRDADIQSAAAAAAHSSSIAYSSASAISTTRAPPTLSLMLSAAAGGTMTPELRRETPFRMDRDLLPKPRFGANKSLPTIKLDSYDGSTPLETHLAKLDNCASYYNWSGRDRLCHLKASLSGQAGEVI